MAIKSGIRRKCPKPKSKNQPLETKEFEQFVEKALKDIPQKFMDLMENITIEVDPDQNVLQHEIGHYFGMSEEELAKYKKC